MLAAGVAAKIDALLAPWDLTIAGPFGRLQLYAHHGPPPSADEWARVQQRLDVGDGAPSAPVTSSVPDDDAWAAELERDRVADAETYAAALIRTLDELSRDETLEEFRARMKIQNGVFRGIERIEADLWRRRRLGDSEWADETIDVLQTAFEETRDLVRDYLADGADAAEIDDSLRDLYLDLFEDQVDVIQWAHVATTTARFDGSYSDDTAALAYLTVLGYNLRTTLEELEP
jgi:hypothetical protein